uniref:Uncharacterized protein n=1 Tax=Micrurus corallinus TaxID=54390 RepID=A0A2D4EMJ1_MICCO
MSSPKSPSQFSFLEWARTHRCLTKRQTSHLYHASPFFGFFPCNSSFFSPSPLTLMLEFTQKEKLRPSYPDLPKQCFVKRTRMLLVCCNRGFIFLPQRSQEASSESKQANKDPFVWMESEKIFSPIPLSPVPYPFPAYLYRVN